ncbi:MAG: hypothetical protein KME10_27060 [Plectolyngbya sp. WJT66-NPBG17]|jgi:hypothetical protein|nr:hypothetical protein [Plectolyngbya sp. WJT66-NPBG17]MBW4528824.1 hypothetical protein [Phormidium tanganyikae FI6-MK23]
MLKSLSFGLLSAAALLPFAPSFTSSASAQCVMLDVSNQLAIHGSQTPSTQQNNVGMATNGGCVGGAAVTTNSQTAVTPGTATQVRKSQSTITDGMQNVPNVPGIGGPTIQIPVNTQVDVYSPALDPTFMNRTFSGIPQTNAS